MSNLFNPTALITLFVIAGGIAIAVVAKQSKLFRGYGDLRDDVRNIAGRLKRGKIDRDMSDLIVTGALEGIPVFVRFSHSETEPGLYIRCGAEADFSFTFEPSSAGNAEGEDICRTGDNLFDRRFVARTDNRLRTKQFLAVPGCMELLQQLCCSNKTKLRLAEEAIELSEELIPTATGAHVIAHVESLVAISNQLAEKRALVGAGVKGGAGRKAVWGPRMAGVAAILVVSAGVLAFNVPQKPADVKKQPATTQDVLASRGVVLSNTAGWMFADVKDLAPEFVDWVKYAGGDPETKITLRQEAEGAGNSVAYVLRATNDQKNKRVIWMRDKAVVVDLVGRIDGISRVPKESLKAISWAEGAAPNYVVDGDALLVVRDHTKPGTATIYFTSQQVLHTAIPEDFSKISLL